MLPYHSPKGSLAKAAITRAASCGTPALGAPKPPQRVAPKNLDSMFLH
jgi:hypothetical protein